MSQLLKLAGAKPVYDPSFPIATKPKIEKVELELNISGNFRSGKMNTSGKAPQNTARQISSLPKGSVVTVIMKVRGADGIPYEINKPIVIR